MTDHLNALKTLHVDKPEYTTQPQVENRYHIDNTSRSTQAKNTLSIIAIVLAVCFAGFQQIQIAELRTQLSFYADDIRKGDLNQRLYKVENELHASNIQDEQIKAKIGYLENNLQAMNEQAQEIVSELKANSRASAAIHKAEAEASSASDDIGGIITLFKLLSAL